MTSELKSLAFRAGDDLSAMYEAADAIKGSSEATREQIEAAIAALRSIAAVMTMHTDMRAGRPAAFREARRAVETSFR